MNTIQNILLTDWHLMRIVRLGIGLAIGFNAWQESSGLIGLLAGLLIIQALSNTGCCGAGGCSVPSKTNGSGTENEITFTEIQSDKNHENKF